ncbi:hypothetical protein F4782DRAFT_522568 [Xylaria castorea]|nr:hypothetical protein F4782DRAFT_522568 [Xylaria castorea]
MSWTCICGWRLVILLCYGLTICTENTHVFSWSWLQFLSWGAIWGFLARSSSRHSLSTRETSSWQACPPRGKAYVDSRCMSEC